MVKYSMPVTFIIILLSLFSFPFQSSALEPLSEEELYDTSGRATPTVSIKYSDDLTVDYFNQNVFIFEPRGEQFLEINGFGWIDTDSENALVLNWQEPGRMVFEFDKYQYYPEGILVSVSDIFLTGEDGRPLPQFAEFDPFAPSSLPPNTYYLRTRPGPTTVSYSHTFDIALVGTVREYDMARKEEILKPDWEQAEDPSNILLSVYTAGKTRTEVLGYIYVWVHP